MAAAAWRAAQVARDARARSAATSSGRCSSASPRATARARSRRPSASPRAASPTISALEEIAAILHRVALAQAGACPAADEPDARARHGARAAPRRRARAGDVPDRARSARRDLALAPDEFAGLHDGAAAHALVRATPSPQACAPRRARAAPAMTAPRARPQRRRTDALPRRRGAGDGRAARRSRDRHSTATGPALVAAPRTSPAWPAWSRATASSRRSRTTISSSSCPRRIACTRRRRTTDKLKAELAAALRPDAAPHGARGRRLAGVSLAAARSREKAQAPGERRRGDRGRSVRARPGARPRRRGRDFLDPARRRAAGPSNEKR